MNRILTFAEFAKSFNQKGTELGNSPADVEALASSTDQFTADNSDGACPDGDIKQPEVVDGGGDKVITLAVQPDSDEEGGEGEDEPAEGAEGNEEELVDEPNEEEEGIA